MGGSVDFKTALTRRLGVMQPCKADIDTFLKKNPHKVTKGVSTACSMVRGGHNVGDKVSL